ncbi:hypothetical protein [Streptomyces mirabilis]|uniref:hypothetical protein n=1 Tax=Streptomyces mirabilis TaxID=68239 RepID=UPI0036C75AEE
MSPRWEPDPQLLANSLATVFGLGVLITLLSPVSGAHFNPAVIRLVRTTATAVWARTARAPMGSGRPGSGERRCDSGCGDQEGPKVDVGRSENVDHRDNRDQRDRYRQQDMTSLP